MQPSEYDYTQDAMPAEVALAYLTDPRAKISNTFRKVCRDARSNITPSTQTLECEWEDGKKTGFLTPTSKTPVSTESKVQRKIKSASLQKLGQTVRRCSTRSKLVMSAIKKAKTDFIKQQLNATLLRLQFVHNAALDEIARRNKICNNLLEGTVRVNIPECERKS